jgi:RNA polymerase sigma-70 factor (ECF subfamily)
MNAYEHLFRREAGRMVATLARIFGVHNLALAEDVVQDAFCRALEVWSLRGMPDNPSAWLMTTAKNRALDMLRRERTARTFAPDVARFVQNEAALAAGVDQLFEPHAIQDDLLRMMFSCCDPSVSADAQVSAVLHVLCGFSVDEIAAAFVTTRSAIEKRLTRAKKTLAASTTLFDVEAGDAVASRLPSVHRALYLLFNEGYHGASPEAAVRADLCREAMRLLSILLEHPSGRVPASYALAALMHLGAARLPGRVDAAGNLSALFDQDRSQWDDALMEEGMRFLELSASGPELTEYHLEAAIAWVHVSARRPEDTDWDEIISLYDTLMKITSSPVVALNRAIAVAERHGPSRGLEAIDAIDDAERLESYPFYRAAKGALELRLGHKDQAAEHFAAAVALARNPMERRYLTQRLAECERN